MLSLNKPTWSWHTVHLHMVAFDLLIFCFWFFCWGLWKLLFRSFLFLWTFVWSEWYWPHNMSWEVIHLSLLSDRVCVDNFTHLFFSYIFFLNTFTFDEIFIRESICAWNFLCGKFLNYKFILFNRYKITQISIPYFCLVVW